MSTFGRLNSNTNCLRKNKLCYCFNCFIDEFADVNFTTQCFKNKNIKKANSNNVCPLKLSTLVVTAVAGAAFGGSSADDDDPWAGPESLAVSDLSA